jgi:Flp pilus assembly protein TadD
VSPETGNNCGSTVNLNRNIALVAVAVSCAAALCQPAPDGLAEVRRLMDANAFAQAEQSLQRYVTANPSSADAHFLLGFVLFREQKATESLAEFTLGAKYRRPKADELKAVAGDYVLLGDFADANKWFSEVTKESPADADAWYLLGRTEYNEGLYQQAVSSFEHALELLPRYVEAENNLGLSWRELGETDKARAAFQAAVDWQGEHPTDAQPFLNLGSLFADQGKLEEAQAFLTRAAALAPDNPKVHEELAHIYEAQSNLPKAQNELEKAIALAPNTSALHYKLGRVYRREGKRDQAQSEFATCDKLNGSHSSVETPNPPNKSAPQ